MRNSYFQLFSYHKRCILQVGNALSLLEGKSTLRNQGWRLGRGQVVCNQEREELKKRFIAYIVSRRFVSTIEVDLDY
jgi:hypothetical protein